MWEKVKKYTKEYLDERRIFCSSAITGVFTGLIIGILFNLITLTDFVRWIDFTSYEIFVALIYFMITYALLYLFYFIGKLLIFFLISNEEKYLTSFRINYFAGMYSSTSVASLIILWGKIWIASYVALFCIIIYFPLEYFAVVGGTDKQVFIKICKLIEWGFNMFRKIIIKGLLDIISIVKSKWSKINKNINDTKQTIINKLPRILFLGSILVLLPIWVINMFILDFTSLYSDSLNGSVIAKKDNSNSEYYLPDMDAIKGSVSPVVDYIFEDILAFNTTFKVACFYDNGSFTYYKDDKFSNSSHNFTLNLTFYGDVNNKEDLQKKKAIIYPVGSGKGPSEKCFPIPTVNFTMHWAGERITYISSTGGEWPSEFKPNVGTRVTPNYGMVGIANLLLLIVLWSAFLVIKEIITFIWGK